MNELDRWMIDSEAAHRFYVAIIDIEDSYKYWRRVFYCLWNGYPLKQRKYKTWPPIHCGYVWETL